MAAAASGKQVNKTSLGCGDNSLLDGYTTSRQRAICTNKVTWHCALGVVVEAQRYTKLDFNYSTTRMRPSIPLAGITSCGSVAT